MARISSMASACSRAIWRRRGSPESPSRSRRMTTRQCGSSSIGRTASQPPPVKELTLLIGQVFPHARRVSEDAAVQGNVLAAREDVQRVELQVLHRAHGLLGALDASPAPPGPQALLAKDETTGGLAGDG